VRHLSDGTLRRLCDEPLALSATEREHYMACDACRAREAAIAAAARQVAHGLATPPVRVDTARAFTTLQRRLDAAETAPARLARPRWYERIMTMMRVEQKRLVKPVGGVVAAAAVVGALALTPAGSFAQSLLTVFEPQQIAVIPVTKADMTQLRNLPDLSSYGTMAQGARPGMNVVSTAAAAQAATGLQLRTLASLPAGVPSSASYAVMSQGTASFTFSAAKARTAASRTGQPLPAMPASLDGSTLQMTVGPAVVTTYGGDMTRALGAVGGLHGRNPVRIAKHAVAAEATSGDLPSLAVIQAAAPRLTSTGASVQDIENYLLAQPGISPQLAAEIRSIGDPSATLPLPIPVDKATAQAVQVDGVSGWAIGDNTGIGSAVVWVKNHQVYAVAGPLAENQVLAAANSLQ
jgi:hypothetical protein